jgi:hypothetical protein
VLEEAAPTALRFPSGRRKLGAAVQNIGDQSDPLRVEVI